MCHKTAGLVARGFEEAGIATVIVGTMHKPMESVPRAVVTRYIDAPVGPPGDAAMHREIVARALHLLRYADSHTVEDAVSVPSPVPEK
jgi:hypothetical protein